MSYNLKIMVIILIICFAISIGGVSAAELGAVDNQVVDVSSPDYSTESVCSAGDVNVSVTNNNDVLSAKINSNEVLSEESNVGTYSDLDKLIRLTTSGTTLKLYQDYEFNNNTDKSFNTTGITITKSIIIDGNGHTISGNNMVMGFTVNASDVTLNNLDFVNMTKTFSWFGANGRILNSNFKTPTISWYGDNCVIENSTFQNLLNKDLFYLENNDFLIKNCTFSNITSTGNGIIFSFLDANDCRIVNCNFFNCSNTGTSVYRGILSFYGVSSIENSSFISCGGRNNLIFSSTADVLINNSYFKDITANRLFSAESTGIKFYNCIFYNTTNTLARTDSKTPSLDSGSIVYNCTFIRNSGNWVICTGGTGVNISNSKFYNNTGCIYSNFAYTFIENCEFMDNLGYNGGVVYLNNNNSIVNNCSFSNSTSYDIWIRNNVTANIDSRTANSANISGNITPFTFYTYLTVDNHTNGDGINTPCNISWAIKNIAYGGTIFMKNGVYNITGMQSISCNVLGESRDGVIINNGSFQMFIPYSYVKNITFNNMQQSFQIYNSCTLTDCNFINFNKSGSNIITTRNYAYLHEIRNILVKNSTFNYFYTHGTAGQSYGFIWDNLSFQNCTFKYLTSDNVVTYSSFSNIVFNNSNFTACFLLVTSNNQAKKDIHLYNILINNSNFTYVLNENYIPNIVSGYTVFIVNNVTVLNSNASGTAPLFTMGKNSIWTNFTVINLNNLLNASIFSINGITNHISDVLLDNFNTTSIVAFSNSSASNLDNFTMKNINTNTSFILNNNAVLSNLNFNNVNFTSGISINLTDGCQLINSTFNRYTGHVIIDGNTVTIHNSNFINGNNDNLTGGCIYLYEGNFFTLNQCNFTNNNASNAAVFIRNVTDSSVISYCNFTGNNATNASLDVRAGAIYIESGVYYSIDEFTHSTVNKTSTHYNNIIVDLTKVKYSTVYVVFDPDVSFPGQPHNGNLREDPTTFMKAIQAVARNGKIIFIESGEIYNSSSNIRIPCPDTGVEFIGNNTVLNGYKMSVTPETPGVKIYNFIFNNTSDASVIIWSGNNGLIENCTFMNNGGNDILNGSALYIDASNLTIRNSVFRNNSATSLNDDGIGGALYVNSTNITVDNCTFDSNFASNTGVHIYLESDVSNININNSRFINGEGTGSGSASAIHVQGETVVINNSTFYNNSGKKGSALYVGSTGTFITISNSNIINNTCLESGSIYLVGDVQYINIINNNLSGNNATNGGALFIDSFTYTNSLIISSNNYTYNNALNGGAVYINTTGVSLLDSGFSYNNATYGGAVYINGIDNNLINCTFTYNNATNGSAIYIAPSKALRLYNVYLDWNYVVGEILGAGDIYPGSNSTLSVPNNDLYLGDNTYKQFIYNGTDIFSEDMYVKQYGTGSGLTESSAASLDWALKHISPNGRIHVLEDLIYSSKLLSNLSNVTFEGNNYTIRKERGSEYLFILEDSSINFKNVTLMGGIDVGNNNTLNLDNVLVTNITGNNKGILYNTSSKGNITNTRFENNNIDSDHLITINGGNVTVNNTSFINNGQKIGVIGYYNSSTGNVSDTIFNKNRGTTRNIFIDNSNADNKIAVTDNTFDSKLSLPFPLGETINVTYGTGFSISGVLSAGINFNIINAKLTVNTTVPTTILVNVSSNGAFSSPVIPPGSLTVGQYNITLTTDKNGNYYDLGEYENVYVFNVVKAPVNITIAADNITYNQQITVKFNVTHINKTVTVPGKVNVTLINKNTGAVISTQELLITAKQVIFKNLSAANYTVNVSYSGNANFTANSTLFDFTVYPARTNVTVKVNDTTFNQTVIVDYSLQNINNTGAKIPNSNVIITVTDSETGNIVYYNSSAFTNQKGTLAIKDYEFAAGNYILNVTYLGSENFTGNTTLVNFTVSKARTNVSVNVNVTTFNQSVIVEYALNNINGTNAHIPDGVIIVDIINRSTGRPVYYNSTVAFVNEKGVLVVDHDFGAGDYSVNVTYKGNENFTGNFSKFDFTVLKARTNVTATIKNTTFNQTVVIDYTLANINNTNAIIPDGRLTVNITNRDTGDSVYYKSNVAFVNEEGALSIISYMFAAGNYTANITYGGNENFTASSALVNFTVSKARSNVTVSVNNSTFNQDVVIGYVLANVNNTNAHIPNGNVIINITNKNNGRSVYYNSTASFTKERGIFRISDYELAAANYTVTVTYAGNENFTGNSTKFDFTVFKARSSVSGSAGNATFNDTVAVEFGVSNINNTNARIPATDNVVITVYDSSNNPVSGYNGVNAVIGDGKFNVSGLKAGNYTVNVTYNGNENFTGNSTKFNFTVFKAYTNVTGTADNVIFNGTVVVEFAVNNINPNNAHVPTTDKVVITVYDSSNNPVSGYNGVNAVIGDGKFNVSGLKAGDYTVNITYNGNENFTGNSTKFAFTVLKARSNVTVKVNDSTFNQTVSVEYVLANTNSSNSPVKNGNVIINIVNKNTGWSVYYNSTATFTNGKGTFKISDYEFAAGNYTANVIYEGNENFTGNSSKFDFTVFKARSNVTVKVNDSTFNQTVVIQYNINNINNTNAHIPNGNVIVSIIDKNTGKTVYYNSNAEFTSEKGSIAINNYEFGAGNYSVNVAYNGNENFTGNFTVANFTVLKARTNVSVNINNITFDDTAVVEFKVNNINGTNAQIPAGEKVTITVYDSSNNPVAGYNNVDVFIDSVRFNIYDLKAGNYSVNVTYNGNENFTGNSTKFKFTVHKASSNTTVKVNNSTFNQAVVVEYNLNNVNATGAHISDGNVIINITNKTNGRSVYYNPAASFVNEKGIFEISDYEFGAGNYTLNVTYAGNENFTGSSALADFTVFKAHSNVTAKADDSIFNQTVIVEFNVNNIDNADAHIPDGTVAVNITNKDTGRNVYYNSTVAFTNEKGVLIINNYEFAPGNYTVNVTYNGNENVGGSSAKFDFTVSKARSNITVNVNESTFNQKIAIEYTLNNIDTDVHIPNAKVSINITSKETYQSVYYTSDASFTNEKGVFTVNDYEFAAGRYSVNVTYGGNDNFTASSTRFDFTVSKARTNITVKVNNTTFNQTIAVNYTLANINNTDVHIPDGKVVISITNRDTGRTVYYNNNADFANEKGNIIIDTELGAGNYTLNVIYNGNKNFTGNSTSLNFTVFKARTNVSGNVNNVSFNNSAVVEFNVNNIDNTNARVPSGENVVITVYDSSNNPVSGYENINALIGDAMFSIAGLDAGNYSVNVTYPGNDNFIGSSSKFKFSVLKASTIISVNVGDVTFNQTVSVDFGVNNADNTGAHVPDGDVSINITNKNTGKSVYYNASAAFVNEKGSLTIDNYEFAAGNYTVKVTYNGNVNFTANSTLFNFTVSKARTGVESAVTNVTFNDSVVVSFTVNNINNTNARIPAGDKVIITVYDASNNPVAGYNAVNANIADGQFNIDGLKAGNYSVNVTYAGNENFTGNYSKLNFTVFKAHTNITSNVNSTTFNQSVVVEFILDNTDNDAVISKGNVIVDITDKETGAIVYHNSTVAFTNEKGALVINNYEFGAGNYIVNVTFADSENFTGNSTRSSFTVSKARTNVTVHISNVTFNQSVVVEFKLNNINNTNAIVPDGKVIIDVISDETHGSVYYNPDVSFTSETGVFTINDYVFDKGDYTVNVIYEGNENFTGNSSKFSFSVSKTHTSITGNASDVTFNESILIEYELNNIDTDAVIPDGKVWINVTNKDTGDVVYTRYSIPFNNQKGIITIDNYVFEVGNYSVNIAYGGDDNFMGNSSEFDFTVSKAHTSVFVNVNNVIFNKTVVVDYNLTNLDTSAVIPDGIVTFNIISKDTGAVVYHNDSVLFTNQKGSFLVDFEFDSGNYTINVTYNGSNNFLGNSSKSDFTVFKAHTSVTANADNSIFNNTVAVKYTLYNIDTAANIPDGNVNVVIINKITGSTVYSNTGSFNSQKGILYVDDFEFNVGNYTVKITYDGADNFIGNSTEFNFTISKAKTSISVNVNDITYNQTTTVEFELNNIDTSAVIPDGKVIVSVIDKNSGNIIYSNDNVAFDNEKGIFTISDRVFDAGDYTVNVTYGGSDNFVASSMIADFKVFKAATSIIANASNAVFNEPVTFNVDVININNTDAVLDKNIEKVEVNIVGDNGYSYSNVAPINDASTVLNNLGAGNYHVTVKYGGNDNFLASKDLAFDFIVLPADTVSSVVVMNVTYDNRVSLNGNVSNKNTTAAISNSDKIALKVINNESGAVYSVDITVGDLRNGYTLPLLDAGNYTLNVHYMGCENFTESESLFEFNIARANSIIKFNDDYVVIGNNLTFDVVNITDGRIISLKVNGRTYEGTVIGGVGYILIDNAESGTFNNVLVEFGGDTNYNPSNDSNTVKFIRPDSFTALQLLIDDNTNGSLDLDKDYVFDSNTDDVNGIVVDKPIYIMGNEHIIDANRSARIFNITADDVSLELITLINANASDNGGAILWSGNNGNIVNGYFVNNSAVNGGAIDVKGNELTIEDSVFINNSAVNGGAIDVDGDGLTINKSAFYNNFAVNGGAIDVGGDDSTIYDSLLVNNSAVNGGAINANGDNLAINKSLFAYNSAVIGDSINIENVNNINISDSDFSDSIYLNNTENVIISNTSFQMAEISDNSIISINNALNTNITGVDFNKNNLSDGASLINVDNSITTSISDTSFTDNNVSTNSNIINIVDSNDSNLDNIIFNNNTITDNSSIISIANSEATVVNASSFNYNDISDSTAVSINSDDVILDNSKFNNNALVDSNILDIYDSDNVNITNSDFANNILTNSSVADIAESSDVNLLNDNFVANNGDENSSVMNIINSENLTINNAVISNNTVSGDNSIVNIIDSNVDIFNSLLANNTADNGTVILIDSDSEVYVDNITRVNNSNNYGHRDVLYETSVVIDSSDIHVGEVAVVNASVITSYPFYISGIVIVMANGDKYYFALSDDKGSFSIEGLKEGIYNITAIYAGNDYIDETISNTVVINVSKVDDYNFTLNSTDITTSESLVMNLPSDASGNVNVTIGNESFVVPVIDGKAIIDGEDLPLGSNIIKATYSGDDKYASKDLTDNINVKCDDYNITIENKNIIYGDDLVIDLPSTASGNVSVTIGDESFNIPIDNGKVIVPGDNLPIGFNNITVNYTGDDKYNPNVLSDVISVRLNNYTLDVDSDVIVHGDDLVVVLPSDASGNVSVTIGNDTVVVPVVDGKAAVSTDNISNGDYNVSISYLGDDKYAPQDSEANISVVSGIVVTAPDVVKYYGGPERFIVNVADIKGRGIADKTVTITLNGINYTRVTNEYGNVSFPLNLPNGEYSVLISVDDGLYNSSVIINPTIIGNDLVKVYKNDSQYYVTVYGFDGNYLAPGSTVTFNINGVFYTRYVGEDGRVKLNINLPQGTYIITANNTVTGEVCANNVTVISRIVDNYDLVKYFRNDSQYYVTLLDDNGNPVGAGEEVTFNINGVFYTRQTNASGVAKLNINLPKGEYIITAEYKDCVVSNKITVLPTLTGNDLVKKYGTRDQFVVNVYDAYGNPYPNQSVTFNINGVFYNRVSGINGQAKLNINLPAGEYIITSTYNGASIANKVTVVN